MRLPLHVLNRLRPLVPALAMALGAGCGANTVGNAPPSAPPVTTQAVTPTATETTEAPEETTEAPDLGAVVAQPAEAAADDAGVPAPVPDGCPACGMG